MSEGFTSHEEITAYPPEGEVAPVNFEEMESGSSREELLKAFGESDEEISVNSVDELRGMLREIGLPDEEIERRLSGIPE
jgi:hypothetical protein